MPIFYYKAINQDGKTIKGELIASHDKDLERKLKAIDLDLIDCKIVTNNRFIGLSNITNQELIIFCIQLHQLEKAGVPLLESLSDIRDTTENPIMRNILTDLYDEVHNGKLLSDALNAHNKIFDNIFIGLIKTGETTGNLSEVLNQLIIHLKWVTLIKKKIKKATTYPTFMLMLMVGIILFMMLFVVPQLTGFLEAQNIELPIYTRSLITTSKFFGANYPIIIFTLITIFMFFKFGNRVSTSIGYMLDSLILKLPKIGPTIRKIEIARFCRFFSITFNSGISILDCIETSAGVINNMVIKESIKKARQQVMDGVELSAALSSTGQFPKLVLKMFKIGEKSGNLDKSLVNVNYFYDDEVEETINSLISFIQPTLTAVLGIIMAWIIVSVFGPLYSNFGSIK